MDVLTNLEVALDAEADKAQAATLPLQAQALRALKTIQATCVYYETKINQGEDGMSSDVTEVMRVVAAEVERDGMRLDPEREPEAPNL